MATPSLDTQNRVLVAKVADLKEKRSELQRSIQEDELLQVKYEEQLVLVKRRIGQLADSIERKKDLREEYQKIIEETEGAYSKLLESSEKLLSVLNRDAEWLDQGSVDGSRELHSYGESEQLM